MILVLGATGRQGGAVARCLLEDGWRVRALSREPNSARAHALARLGCEVVPGDLDDRASLERAVDGAYGLFSVQDFWEHGFEGEVRQGKNLIDAAQTAGRIEHFVYSSIAGAGRQTQIPHFESKRRIEEHLAASGLPATILRPVFFMENFNTQFRPSPQGELRLPLSGDRPLQMIAVDDIGALAAVAFDRGEELIGRAIEIAGDEKTPKQVALLLGEALLRPIRFVELPLDEMRRKNLALASQFEWLAREGWHADIEAVRWLHPGLMKFQMWLHHHARPAFAEERAPWT